MEVEVTTVVGAADVPTVWTTGWFLELRNDWPSAPATQHQINTHTTMGQMTKMTRNVKPRPTANPTTSTVTNNNAREGIEKTVHVELVVTVLLDLDL